MSSKHNHEDPYELLGAYALNAVDEDDRAVVEAFLEENPDYQAELDEYRAAAALLAIGHEAVPSQLWERIQTSVEPIAPPMRLIAEHRSAHHETRRYKVAAAVMSAAAVLLIAVLGTSVIRNEQKPDASPLADLALAAKSVPGAKSVSLTSADKEHSADVVMMPDGHGFLSEANLPTLRADETYQLWAFTSSEVPVSVAVLGTQASEAAFMVDAPVTRLALTVEHSGGASAPSSMPVISADMA